MYADRRLPGSLDGIDSLNFTMYWNAIKNKINDLRNMPTWVTNHAMKLGLAVSQLEREGNYAAIKGMDLEIRKVNDDIAKAWVVKGYIDKYLPDWMAASTAVAAGVPIVAGATPAPPVAIDPAAFGLRQEPEGFGPGNIRAPYVAPTTGQVVTGWLKSLVGLQGPPPDHGLGILPLVAVAVTIPALAYCVTTGMALYQDYVVKQDLTVEVIKGKLTSGQAKDIATSSRPAEGGIFSNIVSGVGTNVATIAIVGVIGYLGFMYMMQKSASK